MKGYANGVNKFPLTILTALLLILLSGCSDQSEWKFGFVGGLSGRVADLGGPARNGMLLAIEEANAGGGVDGRMIKTSIKDDKQNPETAVAMVKQLLEEKVDVIIGPVTSSMAMQVVPLANKARTVMMGTTVTTNNLSGLDDYFLRTISPTQIHVVKMAEYLFNSKNVRRYAGIYDLRNKAYSKSWIDDFDSHFQKLGGKPTRLLSFASGNQEALINIADQLLLDDPDMILMVTNSVDAALLAKLIRARDPDILIGTSEWAGTERLIELGGKHVENAIVPQYLDRESKDPDYNGFRARYKQRFNHEPGFPGMITYNATNVIVEALRKNPDRDQLKSTILGQGNFKGIQGDIFVDQYGDGNNETFVCEVINSNFVVQER